MYIRYLRKEQHEAVKEYLATKSKPVTHSISYDAPVTVNGVIYLLRIQPDRGRRIVILQVVKRNLFRDCEVLTDNAFLSALTEVLIYQIRNANNEDESPDNSGD